MRDTRRAAGTHGPVGSPPDGRSPNAAAPPALLAGPAPGLRGRVLPEGYALVIWAVLAGVGGALATLAFRQGIRALQWLLTGSTGSVVEMAQALPWYARILLPTLGGLAAGGLLV